MLAKRIGALAIIFVCTTVAWVILGSTIDHRTRGMESALGAKVERLWGTVQRQTAPAAFTETTSEREVNLSHEGENVLQSVTVTGTNPVVLDSSDIDVKLHLDHRKKGLHWYSTYRVKFAGRYAITNPLDTAASIVVEYSFPDRTGIYDNFAFRIGGDSIADLNPTSGKIRVSREFAPGETKVVEISYGSNGMNQWWYLFGENVSAVRGFNLTMTTDFDDIDFPPFSISPTHKKKIDGGWVLTWNYDSLISGLQIGMDLPQRLNPGPFVARVSFFAPVSLFFFFFIMFLLTTVKNIRMHPMNYFFIAAAFFAFHILMAYLVDHINIHLACGICSAVSIFLLISYMRLVVGTRFALVETGISQFVYLVLFSYAFFLEGFTGLAITICSIVTLFVSMQYTGRIDWEKMLSSENHRPDPSSDKS